MSQFCVGTLTPASRQIGEQRIVRNLPFEGPGPSIKVPGRGLDWQGVYCSTILGLEAGPGRCRCQRAVTWPTNPCDQRHSRTGFGRIS